MTRFDRPRFRPDRLLCNFGGGAAGGMGYIPQPTPVQQDDSAQQEAARKERLADAKAVGRSATILTDYALAMKQPSTLKPTLGA